MLLEQRVGTGAVGPDEPQRLHVGPIALQIFPAGVGDRAVVERMGHVVAVLAHTQTADAAAVAVHHVQIARRFVLVHLVALQRAFAAVGNEGHVAAG